MLTSPQPLVRAAGGTLVILARWFITFIIQPIR
jgi:hypothetical protein